MLDVKLDTFTIQPTRSCAIVSDSLVTVCYQLLEAVIAKELTKGVVGKEVFEKPGDALATILGQVPSTLHHTIGFGIDGEEIQGLFLRVVATSFVQGHGLELLGGLDDLGDVNGQLQVVSAIYGHRRVTGESIG